MNVVVIMDLIASDPSVTENHQILITERNGTTVSSPVALDVVGVDFPDASAGMGVCWKVTVNQTTGEDD